MIVSELIMANFTSLPREIRDLIYRQVLVSPLPIHFSNIHRPIICDPDLLGPVAMLFVWASNRQIAEGACEIFYQSNTYVVDREDLSTFLGARFHRMLSIDISPFVHREEPTSIRPLWTKAWVTYIGVFIGQDVTNYPRDLSCELRYLFECPRLRELTILGRRDIVMG